MAQQSCLYIVATPIGNLGDITYRAVQTLQQVDVIAAEDTRHSRYLLQHYAITTPLVSVHEHNESQRISSIINRLEKGEAVALISDAGTPLISDPGYSLMRAVQEAGFQVVPIPGACAAISGLVVSGLATDRFVFEGFLPSKGSVRRKRIAALQHEQRSIILYESPHRILNLIELLLEEFGEQREVAIARELTKTFETIHRAPLVELQQWMLADSNQQRGEFVVIIQGDQSENQVDIVEQQRILNILLADMPLKQAVDLTVKITGAKRKPIYQLALDLKNQE